MSNFFRFSPHRTSSFFPFHNSHFQILKTELCQFCSILTFSGSSFHARRTFSHTSGMKCAPIPPRQPPPPLRKNVKDKIPSYETGNSSNSTGSSKTSGYSSNRPKATQVLDDLKDWKPIYRFKHIRAARAIQRLKLYQTGFTCLMVLPLSVWSTMIEQSDRFVTFVALGGSVLACVMLYLMGTYSSRIIGNLYIHKDDPKRLNMARLTFFGSRIDTQLHVDSFVPLTDLNANLSDVYVRLQTTDNLEEELGPLYLSLKYGQILDPVEFQRVFGNIEKYLNIGESKSNQNESKDK